MQIAYCTKHFLFTKTQCANITIPTTTTTTTTAVSEPFSYSFPSQCTMSPSDILLDDPPRLASSAGFLAEPKRNRQLLSRPTQRTAKTRKNAARLSETMLKLVCARSKMRNLFHLGGGTHTTNTLVGRLHLKGHARFSFVFAL